MPDFLEGEVLLLDKPLSWTSFDVVNKIRYALKKHLQVKKLKVGHAGTLDPLASGLLILCTGKKTKSIDNIQAMVKEYTGCITLGATTPSYDLETEPESMVDISGLSETNLQEARTSFLGEIEQIPPIYSAKRINGKKAYELARKGLNPEMQARPVQIFEFELTQIDLPKVYFRVSCSKGTYIRSLANDFGAKLGVGGYLSELRRTAIGEFRVEEAKTLEEVLDEINH